MIPKVLDKKDKYIKRRIWINGTIIISVSNYPEKMVVKEYSVNLDFDSSTYVYTYEIKILKYKEKQHCSYQHNIQWITSVNRVLTGQNSLKNAI